MKGGVFGEWFKEIASLIFTQTIQAFLLAIVMTIILSAMGKAGSGNKSTMAGGLLAIVALSQFGKIEALVKQIFGFKSGAADFNASKRGVSLGALAALGGAKKVLDNGGKIVGGAIGKGVNNAKIKSYQKKIQDNKILDGEIGNQEALSAAYEGATEGLKTGAMVSNSENTETIARNTANANLGSSGGGAGSGDKVGVSSKELQDLSSAIKALTDSTNKAAGIEKKPVTLEEKLKAAQDKKQESHRKMMGGIAETAGALGGATVGMGLGALKGTITGDGALEHAIHGMGIGAGVGDTLGAKAASGTFKAIDNGREKKKEEVEHRQTMADKNDRLKEAKKETREVKKEYKEVKTKSDPAQVAKIDNKLKVEIKQINKQTKQQVYNAVKTTTKEGMKQIKKENKEIDKANKKTYNNQVSALTNKKVQQAKNSNFNAGNM